MAGNASLNKANKAKKDEFYTQLADIELELKHYRKHFKGKTVLCNCDDPFESNFFKYFAMNFNYLGLKKLIATCYQGSPTIGEEFEQLSLFGMAGEAPKRFPYKIEITEVVDANGDGAVDLTDVAYLLRNKKNALTLLSGDGDFRSEECVELLKEADVVVTNPPFSLFREYLAQLIEYDKKFLIIGNKNAITYKEVFPLLKDNKIWTGYRGFSGGMWFYSDYEGKTEKVIGGKKVINVPSIWFTNLDHNKRHVELELYKRYTPEVYPHYDNYDAIEVSATADIPEDYDGIMGVPITFLDKYNPDQFEIIGMAKRGAGDPKLKSKVYTKADYPNYSDLNATPVIIENGKPRNTYPRILIRRRRNGN